MNMNGQALSMALTQMQQEVMENCDAKGWYDTERSFGEDIALLHSEVSEALEAFRDYGFDQFPMCRPSAASAWAPCTVDNCERERKVLGVGSELADVFIRLLDTCGRRGIDLYAEYERKMAFNKTRPYRHGGKSL